MHRFVIIAIFMFSQCLCWAFTGKVVNVADGDTITILTPDKSQVKVRLYGIDTPEKGQAFGSKAADFTKERAALQEVDVREIDRDRYGRTVGIVKLPAGQRDS
ncbi:thermonuclease family protein [Solidesulfovibrio sp.]